MDETLLSLFLFYPLMGRRPADGGGCFYMIARGLRAPGPRGYFCPATKVPKNAPKPGGSGLPEITGDLRTLGGDEEYWVPREQEFPSGI